jgi:acyl carrier protein
MSEYLQDAKEILCEQLGCDGPMITLETTFEQLGLDSLDTIELVMAFEEKYDIDINDEEYVTLKTVGDIVKALEDKLEHVNNPLVPEDYRQGRAERSDVLPSTPPSEPASDTPETDAAYFAPGATMYSLAGVTKTLERQRDALKKELDEIKDYLWPDQTGLPNEHRNALIAIKARDRLSQKEG